MKETKRLQLGKKGLTPEFIEQVKNMFENERVIKISILKSACRNKKDAEKIGEDLVSALGNNFKFRLIGYVMTVMKFRKDVRD
jgi:RNA-binding protein YhbY